MPPGEDAVVADPAATMPSMEVDEADNDADSVVIALNRGYEAVNLANGLVTVRAGLGQQQQIRDQYVIIDG